jgi:broad specificity phosphatase PhoE
MSEIELYLFRHAEALDQGLDSELTEQGIAQAKEAAEALIKEIIDRGGGIIKFLSSPIKRARQTSQIMQQVIKGILFQQHLDSIRLLRPRDRNVLRAAGVVGALMERGIADPVNYWLHNPEALDGKNPGKTALELLKFIETLRKVSDRLPSGERIFYIGITHDAPLAALLNRLSGNDLNELGGNLKNCESMRIEIMGKSEKGAVVHFRDKEMRIGKEELTAS